VGFGDRLGLATPGHVWAARRFDGIVPIFAQQSVRENARTGRTPQEVMDDATWGLFQAGWRGPWGADADHLKTFEAIDAFAAAGFTLFTIDPGDQVDGRAHTAPLAEVEAEVQALPWAALEDTLGDLERRYLNGAGTRCFDLGDFSIAFERETLLRAAAKYGGGIAHTVKMYRYLVDRVGAGTFELEVSVDETETPTSPAEHFYIARELERLDVKWVSLAPRYVGRFEKGVDYMGAGASRTCSADDIARFTADFVKHVAVAQAVGPYKLSIHSGSDKFSLYPTVAKLSSVGGTGPRVHLKTAGTSYLEALRAVARADPVFFREILALACERYEVDRATYHVSARLERVIPALDSAEHTSDLAYLLDQFDARQVFHVTFGSVLERLGARLLSVLKAHESLYSQMLDTHFQKHLRPFANQEG
jgi:hypothetical protein